MFITILHTSSDYADLNAVEELIFVLLLVVVLVLVVHGDLHYLFLCLFTLLLRSFLFVFFVFTRLESLKLAVSELLLLLLLLLDMVVTVVTVTFVINNCMMAWLRLLYSFILVYAVARYFNPRSRCLSTAAALFTL